MIAPGSEAVSAPALVPPAEPTLETLRARAEQIISARPSYKEIVGFYLGVFRTQLEWQGRVRVGATRLEPARVEECLNAGEALAARFDPGLDAESLTSLWQLMKPVFRDGNKVLRAMVEDVEAVERRGFLSPGTWLAALRPRRLDSIAEAAAAAGVDAQALGVLARAATAPHWREVARVWLAAASLERWRRFRCPVCDGLPALGELRTGGLAAADFKTAPARWMHCGFCGTAWPAPSLPCPACESIRLGDAKYFFSPSEPGIRVDFCTRCKRYLKVVDGDRLEGPLHVGLESVGSAHVDRVATRRGLRPLANDTGPSRARKENGR